MLENGNFFSAYGREGVKMNFIDRIFVGELTSTIMCEECENVSILKYHLLWKRYWYTMFSIKICTAALNSKFLPVFSYNPD